MSSRTGQLGFGWRGALLVVVMGLGWGCAQLINADFDNPLGLSDAGGGGTSADSSVATGGETSTSSVSSSGTSSSVSSASATGAGGAASSSGAGGADGCSSTNIGACTPATVSVYIKVDYSCGDAKDVTTNNTGIEPPGFDLASEFQILSKETKPILSNMRELNVCIDKTKQYVSIGSSGKCKAGDQGFQTLGYVFDKTGDFSELQQLKSILTNGGNNPIVAEIGSYKPCCNSTDDTCTDVDAYGLP